MLHYLLTFSFTHMIMNFWTICSELATGDLPNHLIYVIDTINDLIAFNNKTFFDYLKDLDIPIPADRPESEQIRSHGKLP